MRILSVFTLSLLSILMGCSTVEDNRATKSLFIELSQSHSGIEFNNKLEYTETLNPYTFRNFYNGGGVGLGDINNDGMIDIFFSGNLVANKLYLNKGGLRFEDISEKAGINPKNVWTTGISMVDINADGWLDIYLCKSGPPGGSRRHNELFINNGDLTFTEQAKSWGLAFEGLATHSAFFDYDLDGDLDCYLLNNSFRPVGGFDLRVDQRKIPDPKGGNKLLRNNGSAFVDITEAAGIFSSEIGFGLGVTVGDLNKDGWPDLYVSNDFFEKDYLYINKKDGSFVESLENYMREISLGSMGADMADINNDELPEIFVTEMLPEHDDRLKTTAQFESYDRRMQSVQAGYYHQFGRNVLQLNRGEGLFSEIGRLAHVEATDWSWGALIFDMDNDGWKDIFVANGIYKDLLDQDYATYVANPDFIRQAIEKKGKVVKQLIDSIPSNPIANYAFQNQKDLTFKNVTTDWGLSKPTFSNGSAYGDLDNDGDLDLIINNVNMPATIFENHADTMNTNHTLSVSLTGNKKNLRAIGSKINLTVGSNHLYQELFPMRGFMSSVDYKIHFGLGENTKVDTVKITWPDGRQTFLKNIKADQHIVVDMDSARDNINPKPNAYNQPLFKDLQVAGVNFKHRENDFVDFDRDKLLFNMVSNEGPCLCTADINHDGLDDFYMGGAKGQPGSLFVQTNSKSFRSHQQILFTADQESEDTDCLFFDANKDGWTDLYVASGGNEFSSSSFALTDRLYFSNKGNFSKGPQVLPDHAKFESTSTVRAADYDQDGDLDIFVGVRLLSFQYGLPASSYLLKNDGQGKFTNVTEPIARDLLNIGMVTSSQWMDFNKDGFLDLVVAGEWMGVRALIQRNGLFVDESNKLGFSDSNGWYHSVAVADLNSDGFEDLVVGNHGLNSRFRASKQEPLSLWVGDFDSNGTLEQIVSRYDNGHSYPFILRNDLLSQIPSLKKKFLYFDQYKAKTIDQVFTPAQLKRARQWQATQMETIVWLNQGGQSFSPIKLPVEAQFAPVYSILIEDFNHDSVPDIFLGGNLYRAKPETGIYDASYGQVFVGLGNGSFKSLPPAVSGLTIKGEIRAVKKLKIGETNVIAVARNNDTMVFYKY